MTAEMNKDRLDALIGAHAGGEALPAAASAAADSDLLARDPKARAEAERLARLYGVLRAAGLPADVARVARLEAGLAGVSLEEAVSAARPAGAAPKPAENAPEGHVIGMPSRRLAWGIAAGLLAVAGLAAGASLAMLGKRDESLPTPLAREDGPPAGDPARPNGPAFGNGNEETPGSESDPVRRKAPGQPAHEGAAAIAQRIQALHLAPAARRIGAEALRASAKGQDLPPPGAKPGAPASPAAAPGNPGEEPPGTGGAGSGDNDPGNAPGRPDSTPMGGPPGETPGAPGAPTVVRRGRDIGPETPDTPPSPAGVRRSGLPRGPGRDGTDSIERLVPGRIDSGELRASLAAIETVTGRKPLVPASFPVPIPLARADLLEAKETGLAGPLAWIEYRNATQALILIEGPATDDVRAFLEAFEAPQGWVKAVALEGGTAVLVLSQCLDADAAQALGELLAPYDE